MRKVLREGGESFIRSNPILPLCSCAYEKSSYAKVASLLLGLTQSFPYPREGVESSRRKGSCFPKTKFLSLNQFLSVIFLFYESTKKQTLFK